MSPELTDKLVRAFPHLYQGCHMSPRENLMCFGFECGDGWFQLIYDLSQKLTDLINALPEADREHYYAMQVKEKFGELRFYMTSSTDAMEDAIDEATAQSLRTCEMCGMPGQLHSDGWMYTACEEHTKPGSEALDELLEQK